MNEEPRCIDTCYTIELYRAQRCVGYSQGTPIGTMLWLRNADSVCIVRSRWMSDGNTQKTDLTWRITQFQQIWRLRRAFMRRVLSFVRQREVTGGYFNHPATREPPY